MLPTTADNPTLQYEALCPPTQNVFINLQWIAIWSLIFFLYLSALSIFLGIVGGHKYNMK